MMSTVETATVQPIAPALPYYSNALREYFSLNTENTQIPGGKVEAANIPFHPDLEKYEARKAARLRSGGLEKTVPVGWPTSLKGPLVWTGADFHDEKSFIHQLTPEEISEIKNALKHVNGNEPYTPVYMLTNIFRTESVFR